MYAIEADNGTPQKGKGELPLIMLQGERNREKLYAENFTCQHITTTVYSICKVESRLLNFLHVHSSKTGPSKYLENYAHWFCCFTLTKREM